MTDPISLHPCICGKPALPTVVELQPKKVSKNGWTTDAITLGTFMCRDCRKRIQGNVTKVKAVFDFMVKLKIEPNDAGRVSYYLISLLDGYDLLDVDDGAYL